MELRRRRPENPCKRYVKVRADFGLDGSIRPLLFRGADRESAMCARWREASPCCFTTSCTGLSSGKRTPDARQRWRCSLPIGNAGFA